MPSPKKEYIKISREDAEKMKKLLGPIMDKTIEDYDIRYSLCDVLDIINKALGKPPVIKLVDVKKVGKTKCFNCKKLFIPSVVLTFQIDKHHFCSSDCMSPHLPGPQD
jgi:hypothetical protein